MKRGFDVVVALVGLTVSAPVIATMLVLIWLQDGASPFYIATRVGRGGRPFRMFKLRSMVKRADANQVDSTAADDPRITPLGYFVRRFKVDELPQLWNVLKGDMSVVGPRPNVERETRLYTEEERELLSVRPGITDIASIVFSDLAFILAGSTDPNLAYNQRVRPYKSRLGLLYVRNASFRVDVDLILTTILGAIDRPRALRHLGELVKRLGGSPELAAIAARETPLVPAPPPGAAEIVTSRQP